MKKVCPACGRFEEKSEFVGAFCPSCYASRHKLYSLPSVVDVVACPVCGKTLAGEAFGEKAVEKAIFSRLRSQHDVVESELELVPEGKHWRASLKLVFLVEGKRVEKQAVVLVRLQKKQCSNCSRASSGYFEAILQFRGGSKGTAEQAEEKALKAIALLQKKTFVSRVDRVPGGIDVFVGSASEAQKVLHDLGLSYTASKKLVGVKDGRRISRTTFCTRV